MSLREKEVKLNGAIVYFKLGEDSDHNLVEWGFNKLNLGGYIPNKNTSNAALRSALTKTYGSRRTKIDALDGNRGFAVAQVSGDVLNDVQTLDYEVKFCVQVPTTSHMIPFQNPKTGEIFDPPLAQDCKNRFWEEMDKVPSRNLSSSLVNIIHGPLNGICLKDTGGIYWIPETSVPVWQALSLILEQASSRNVLYKISSSIDEDSVKAICDALTSAVESELSQINDEIIGGKLKQKRAYESRRNRSVELNDKVKSYRKILGVALEDLSEQCEDSDMAACAAIFSTFGN